MRITSNLNFFEHEFVNVHSARVLQKVINNAALREFDTKTSAVEANVNLYQSSVFSHNVIHQRQTQTETQNTISRSVNTVS